MKTFSYSILATLLAISMFGCGSSSPRFANRDKSPPSPKAEKKNPVRFSSEAEEEKKEDDRKVEPHEVERIKAGDRDFKKEKNVAIKPLDHSKMMHEISRYMGVPYQLGASDVNGMDCSGYTMVVYKNSIGKTLPRTAGDQSGSGNLLSRPN